MRHAWLALSGVLLSCAGKTPVLQPLAAIEPGPEVAPKPASPSTIACELDGTISVIGLRGAVDGESLALVTSGAGAATLATGTNPSLAIEVEVDGYRLKGYTDAFLGLRTAGAVGPLVLQSGYPLEAVRAEPGRVAVRPESSSYGVVIEDSAWLDCIALTLSWIPGEETVEGDPLEEVWRTLPGSEAAIKRHLPAHSDVALRSEADGPVVARVETEEEGRTAWLLEEAAPSAHVAFTIAGGVVVGWLDSTALADLPPPSDEEEGVWGGFAGTEVVDKSSKPPIPCGVAEPTALEARDSEGLWQRIGTVLPDARFYRVENSDDRQIAPAGRHANPWRGGAWRLAEGATVRCGDSDGISGA